jgi:hypothetical protein
MHKSKYPTVDTCSSQHHLFRGPRLSPTRAPGQTLGAHLHILSTAARPQRGTCTPQWGHTTAHSPNKGDNPTQPHTMEPAIPKRGTGLHRRLRYQGAPGTGCRRGAHPNTHHHLHRSHRVRRDPRHHAYGSSGNSHCHNQIRGPLMARRLHRLPLQLIGDTPPLLQTGTCDSPSLPPSHAPPP